MKKIQANREIGIDVGKLQVEQTFKNYNEMCQYLGLQSGLKGNQKRSQEKEIKRYFDYERVGTGQKLIITDIYEVPLEKTDGRKQGNNSVYVKYIELILMWFLAKQKNYTYTLTKRGWWELLGMVNHKYSRTSPEELKKVDKMITSYEINSFYQRCNKKLEKILVDALRSLHSRRLLVYEPQTILCEKKNGKEMFRVAIDNEKKAILQLERKILKHEFGYENIFQIYVRGLQKEYYARVNEALQQEHGWCRYFKQIKLIYNQEQLREAIPETIAAIQKEALNEKVVEVLNANAIEIYEQQEQKALEEIAKRWNTAESGEVPDTFDIWQPPSNYIEAQRLLTKELIMLGHEESEEKIDYLSPEFADAMKEYEDVFVFLE